MPIEMITERFLFKSKEIWFSESPYDIDSYHLVTFRECPNRVGLLGFERTEFTTLIIDLNREIESIWSGIHRSDRSYIKKGEREGFRICIGRNHDQFYSMLIEFQRKKGIDLAGFSLPQIKQYTTVFTGYHGEKLICGFACLEDENRMRILVGGSRRLDGDKETSRLAGLGTRLMTWEAIKYAKSKGLKEFDLGGYYTGGDEKDPRTAINTWKRGFGGQLVTLYNYTKCYSRLYHPLQHLRKAFSELQHRIIRS